MENDVKKLIEEANKTCFITVTELSKFGISVYVTEKAIMVRDNKHLENSLLIPYVEFIKRREELLDEEINNATTGETKDTTVSDTTAS